MEETVALNWRDSSPSDLHGILDFYTGICQSQLMQGRTQMANSVSLLNVAICKYPFSFSLSCLMSVGGLAWAWEQLPRIHPDAGWWLMWQSTVMCPAKSWVGDGSNHRLWQQIFSVVARSTSRLTENIEFRSESTHACVALMDGSEDTWRSPQSSSANTLAESFMASITVVQDCRTIFSHSLESPQNSTVFGSRIRYYSLNLSLLL